MQKKILIVEDDTSLISMLKSDLEQEGFLVLLAENGQKGLDVAFSEHPDLILLDIVLPVMDGMTMLKKLREDNWGKTAQVTMLTNLSDNDTVAEAMAQGSYEYLVKSDWKFEDVIKKIKEKLK